MRHAVGGDALVEHGDRGVAGFPRSDQGGDRRAGVVVLEPTTRRLKLKQIRFSFS